MGKILIIGYSTECTIKHFGEYLDEEKIEYSLLDFSKLDSCRRLIIEEDVDNLIITLDNEVFDFDQYNSFYQRYYYHDLDNSLLNSCQSRLISALNAYLNHTNKTVVNRPYAGSSNDLKIYHLNLLRECGFLIPKSYIFGCFKKASEVLKKDDAKWISKGCSGTRSVAKLMENEMFDDLYKLSFTPSQFQEFIDGVDVRVHVVGDKCIGLKIISPVTDYRYASNHGKKNKYEKMKIPKEIALACKEFCKADNLLFSGVDFKIDKKTKEWYVLEANPMPGYEFFDKQLNNEISKQLSKLLLSANEDSFKRAYQVMLPTSGFIDELRIPEITPF